MRSLSTLACVALVSAACTPAESASRAAADAAAAFVAESTQAADLVARADRARIQGGAVDLWIVEISDFQCPYCKMWHDSSYPAIKREFIDRGFVRMAYVNLPISQHANAMPAAEAAMCAGAQDKFWPMHDALFKRQARWAPLADASAVFDSLAGVAGVALPEWRECLRGQAMRRLIDADRERAREAGVRNTPTFFIGNEVVAGAAPLDTFRSVINRARKASTARP